MRRKNHYKVEREREGEEKRERELQRESLRVRSSRNDRENRKKVI